MKLKWKRLAALLLAAILMLSLTGLSEEEVIIEDAASIDAPDIEDEDLAIEDAFEGPDLDLDDALELNLSDDILDLVGDPEPEVEDITAAEPTDVAQEESNASNAITLGVKETYTISTKGLGKNLTFKSSKPKVASVTAKGVIKGLKKGTAVVTVMSGTKEKKKITVKVVAAPTKVTLSTKTATLGVKESVTVTAKLPKNSHTTLTWTSKNKAIATVTKAGKITGKKAGTTTITVKTHNGKKATVKVTVAKAPARVTLNKTSASLSLGGTVKLKATLPEGSASSKLTWKSSNTDVATVSTSGKVTAVGVGTAKITVTTFNKKKATCTVTVTSLSADTDAVSMDVGESVTVAITSLVDGDLYWDIDDSSVATCEWDEDWYGDTTYLYIKGLQAGTATVTVESEDTGEVVEIDVTVYSNVETVTELSLLLFKDIDTANAMLEDVTLTDDGDGWYSCDYFMVHLDGGVIRAVGFFKNYGDYTLMGQWPNRSLSNAATSLFNSGWQLDSDENQMGTFSHPDLPGCKLYLWYSNSQVDNLLVVY